MKLFILAEKFEKATNELKDEEKERLDYYKDRKDKTDSRNTKIDKKELGKIEDFEVYLVDGEEVRNILDQDFTTGGSSGRYIYIPEGEVWIEDGMTSDDTLSTLIHEFVECYFMENKGLNYAHAHDKANIYERKVRKAIMDGRVRVRDSEQAFDFAKKIIDRIIHTLAAKRK